jgi:hypothetical protein
MFDLLEAAAHEALARFTKSVREFRKRSAVRNHKQVIREKRVAMHRAAAEYLRLIRQEVSPSSIRLDRSADEVVEAMVDWPAVEEEGRRIFGGIVLETIQAAGLRLTPSQRRVVVKGRVDPIGDAAVKWAKKNTAKLVTEVTAKTKAGIRAVIADSIDSGRALDATRKMISGSVGLTGRQSDAALKVYERAFADGLSHEESMAEMGRYSERALRYREELIAQTESAAASSAGLLAAFEKNDIPKCEWAADLGPGCCEICVERDGQVYSIEEAEGMLPAHPGCECAWLSVLE